MGAQLFFKNDKLLINEVTYHIQTETRGRAESPVIQTLIFSGGRIVDRLRCEVSADNGSTPGDGLFLQLLNQQHRTAIDRLRREHYRQSQRRTRKAARHFLCQTSEIIMSEAAEELEGFKGMTVTGRDGYILVRFSPGRSLTFCTNCANRFALVQGLMDRSLQDLGRNQLVENLITHAAGWIIHRPIEGTRLKLGIEVDGSAVLGNLRLVARKTSAKLGAVFEDHYPDERFERGNCPDTCAEGSRRRRGQPA